MKIQQLHFQNNQWKEIRIDDAFEAANTQLVLAFGASSAIQDKAAYEFLKNKYPAAEVIIASTAGEILGNNVFDDSIAVTAIEFEKTKIKTAKIKVKDEACSFHIGKELMNALSSRDLNSVFIISDGTLINGSNLIAGFNEVNGRNIPISGGLAGDGEKFLHTYVGLNSIPEQGTVVAIGFYGNNFKTTYGSFGGWTSFGPEKIITRSENNVLYELNGKSALGLYKEYLGPYAEELPASALLFPLAVSPEGEDDAVVRTILNINEKEQSMVFAGNMPEGSKVRLMKSNFDKLIDASSIAAQTCCPSPCTGKPELAILISCVGRKLILQERTDEEVNAAEKIFGPDTYLTGFYSYGEISPSNNTEERCSLHNQTMTITTFSES